MQAETWRAPKRGKNDLRLQDCGASIFQAGIEFTKQQTKKKTTTRKQIFLKHIQYISSELYSYIQHTTYNI